MSPSSGCGSHNEAVDPVVRSELVDPELERKQAALREQLSGLTRVVVAYSGGVDSSLLAAVAHEVLGVGALAVTAVSASVALRERRAAAELARRRGWQHIVVHTGEIGRDEYARNASDRCYWCKTELFDVLAPIAAARSAAIAVGTNLDDLVDHRPGLRAAAERSVRAPLADAGLTKRDVRLLSLAMDLPTAEKPASPCLASRVAYGVRVTPERLRRIDRAEELLRAHGFTVLRVRDHGDLARIEVPPSEIARVAELRSEIAAGFGELGFRYVTVDLAGFRSGSMNEVLVQPTFGAPRDGASPPHGAPRD